jgi:hypothetical protein
VLARINREEGISRFNKWRNIFDCFQVIGVRTPGRIPFRGIDRAPGIVHHFLRSSTRAGILADGLLCKDGRKLCATYRSNMSRRGESEPVAEAERGRKGKWSAC